MGSCILEMYLTLVEDFWEFDRQLANYSRGLPRWIIPSAYRTRDRLLANLKAWNRTAQQHSNCSNHGVDDADWDEFFGTRYIKAHQDLMRKHGLNDDAIASDNLGLLFGANANAVRAVFWYLFEALKDKPYKSDSKPNCLTAETRKPTPWTSPDSPPSPYSNPIRRGPPPPSIRHHGPAPTKSPPSA